MLPTLVAGRLAGGRMGNLTSLRLRWGPLALVALLLQVINPPGRWPLVMLLTSFVLLSVFAAVNLRIRGFLLIVVGVALNFTVIGVNEGMPVSGSALIASGQADTLGALTDDADSYVKHHLATADDRLLFLGDVIALPPPISQAFSVGDVFTYGGVAWVVIAGMLGHSGVGATSGLERGPASAPAGREAGRVVS
jgi:hypothetical protein